MSETSRYEAICEASPDGILLVNCDGIITYANARAREMLGYSPDELVGESVEVLVPEDALDGHVAQRDAYLEDPETRPMGANLDLEAVRKDGTTLPVDISLSPISGDDESDVLVMAAVRDISDRETLRRKYQTILGAVPDPVVIIDVQTGKIAEVNDEAATKLDYAPSELVGDHYTKIRPSDDNADFWSEFTETTSEEPEMHAQLSDGSPLRIESRTGDQFPVEINTRVFELADRDHVVAVFRDISARVRRDSQLRELHAATRRLIDAEDRDEVATLIVEAATTILDYRRTVVRYVESDTLYPVEATALAEADLDPSPSYALAHDNPASDTYTSGIPRRVGDLGELDDDYDRGDANSAMYLPIGDHGVLSIGDTELDAFDRSDLELAAILAANAGTALDRIATEHELKRRNERLDAFASVISHDLRNPLNVVKGWIELVDGDEEKTERALDALDRMDTIIDETLTLARQGRSIDDLHVIDVQQLARESWDVVATDDATLTVEESFRIECDPERTRHVFENLFRNAVEHAGPGVTVSVGPLDSGFYVADDGPGVPDEERGDVFDPGQTSAAEGIGIGLTIVREIADAHGWDVGVTESSTGGARFEFTHVGRPEPLNTH